MDNKDKQMQGAEVLMNSLIAEGVDTIFGYPGGAIMPVYDRLYDYTDRLRHILVRHEQGAIHAAQGYSRASGKTGVVLVTSGPGATNVITGITDAMMDSTPVVVICGQVASGALGTDAFQETDLLGITMPITKWNYQIRRPEDVAWAVSRAFYIAGSGRPGPVVLDFAKDAQTGYTAVQEYVKCTSISSYNPDPTPSLQAIEEAARVIDSAERPFVVFGHGILISDAAKELEEFLDKGGIPAGATMLGLSALPSDFKHYKGMLGMHGNIGPNVKTNECDVLIAVGMRFDDRVTGTVHTYPRHAKVIIFEIDAAVRCQIITADIGIQGDAKRVLRELTARISERNHDEWESSFDICDEVEEKKVILPQIEPGEGYITMGEVVAGVTKITEGKAIVVTDVGQNQLIASRYSKFFSPNSFITSGGLGTMGFGIPAAIGAKVAQPDRQVCLFVGDGGLQMTLQEFGTIMQERIGVKIILLNNNWLGNVRMWQELFFDERYSCTRMLNPEYSQIAAGYGLSYVQIEKREDLVPALEKVFADDKTWLVDVHVKEEDLVMPMVPPGKGIDSIMLNKEEWFENGK